MIWTRESGLSARRIKVSPANDRVSIRDLRPSWALALGSASAPEMHRYPQSAESPVEQNACWSLEVDPDKITPRVVRIDPCCCKPRSRVWGNVHGNTQGHHAAQRKVMCGGKHQ